jgi:hypothetical protein
MAPKGVSFEYSALRRMEGKFVRDEHGFEYRWHRKV